jgi:hypothetical protein
LQRLRRVPAFHGLPRLALLPRRVLPQQLLREVLHRPQERVQVQRDRQAPLRKAKDFPFDPERQQLAGSLVREHHRVFDQQLHLDKRVLADRVRVCRCVREADLPEDIPSVLAVLGSEAAGLDKDPLADNAPAQLAGLEFLKLNLASRFTPANLRRRAAVP